MSGQVTITQLPTAAALTGSEAVPVVQSGVTVQTTTGAIAGAGALNYPFLTVGSTAGLTQARYLTTTTGLSLSDTGAGGTLSINMTGAASSLNAAGNGILVKDSASTVINRQLTVGSGMTIANADGVSDNPLIGVNTNLQNLSSLTGTGLMTINGSTFSQTSLVGTTNQISIANGNANGGSPTVSITNDPILPGTGGVQVPSGSSAQRLPVNGVIRYNTDNANFEFYESSSWQTIGTGSGSVTNVQGTANQISVINGTTVPIISITPNPVLPGNAFVQLPAGDTAQRGTPAYGALRYNSDIATLEAYTQTYGWGTIISGAGVATFSAGTTGFTPSTPTSGGIILAGILNVANGGTGVSSSTGTVSVVLSNSPTLVTPNLGTPSTLVGTNITGTAAGLTAGNVTTNANLTGVITSVGNATSIASQTGTGTKFVVDNSPTLITPNLGTPSVLVGTNITGTAAGLTAGNVTTNANLTGMVTSVGNATTVVTNANLTGVITSVGNATSIASQTGTGTKFVVDTSPTLITPALGTPTALVATNATGTAAGLTSGFATALATARTIANVSFDGTANIDIPLGNLSTVTLSTPVVNQLLGYNGSTWTNVSGNTASAGTGVVLYNATPVISASGTQNNVQIATLATIPVVTAEQVITGTANAASGAFLFSAFVSAALGRTIIDAGVWDFTTWIGVDSKVGSNTVTRQVYTAIPFVTGTVTMTGTGTTRTATASAGTPFALAVIDASATTTTASYLQTPAGLYQITARTSDTVVTIGNVPTTYTNESAVAGTVWKKLFGITTGEITNVSPDYGLYEITITAGSYAITTATKIGILGFFNSSTPVTTHTVSITYNGTTRNTHVSSPLANVHNDLAGLNGGTSNEYYHSTLTEYTGTGTGVFVRQSNTTLIAPALGTPTALVGTNITGTAAGLTAGNVTTNANLTGVITSVGNATSIASQTGTGTKFVVDTSPTLITPLLGTPTSGTLTNCTGLLVTGGGTGLATLTANNVILGAGTSTPTFVAPSTTGNVLTSNGTTWTSAASTGGVTSFNAGTTGFTPNTATTGAITLAGTLIVSNGGTGVTTLSGLAYGNGTSAFSAATAAQVVAVISTTAVTNATNAANVAATAGSGTPNYLHFSSAATGNVAVNTNSLLTYNYTNNTLLAGISGGAF